MKPHGHYCKICGEYKANEKFSGKGHAAHICKACQSLPVEERNKEAILTRMMNLPFHLSKEQISWLKKHRKDKRPEVSEAAKAVFAERFPYAERNERKWQLHVGRLEFYVDSPLIDEYGDEFDFCGTFVVDKKTCTISMESSGKTETVTLDRKSMNKLLKSVIHYYEVFCWEEDYGHDIYPDDETQDDDNDDSPVWKIHIEYLNGETQDIQLSDDLPYKVEELAEELLGYFEPDEFDDEEFDNEEFDEDTDDNYDGEDG